MPWLAFTAQNVIDQLSDTEHAAVVDALGGAVSKLDAVVSQVTAQIREDILAGDYALHANTDLIPGGLVNDAIAITRWKLLLSLPGCDHLQTDQRKEEYKASMDKLRLIAAGKRKVEPPAGAIKPSVAGNWNSENKILPRIHPVPRPGNQSQPDNAYGNPSDESRADAT